MKSSDTKSQKHLKYWMHAFLNDTWDGPNQCATVDNYESEHFNSIAGLLSNVKMLEDFNFSLWRNYTNRMIYQSFANSFSKTKIERDSLQDMSNVWYRLKLMNHSREVQEVSLLLIHNKLPVQERLFRIKLSSDPYCPSCPAAVIQDVDHYFTGCDNTKFFWNWIRNLSQEMLSHSTNLEDSSLLNFRWPRSRHARAISWLMSHYIFIVWDMCHVRKLTRINDGAFFGYMRFKYKEALNIGIIAEISGLMQ